jgi:hypothetical protein
MASRRRHDSPSVTAYETNPTVAMILWLLTAGDGLVGRRVTSVLREAR